MGYQTETVNAQFVNQTFVDKLDQGLTKEASLALTTFVRQKLRETGFARKILNPLLVSAADLDRQITEDPVIIVEKEPDSEAATLSFKATSDIRYFEGSRYPVTFFKVESAEFKKSKFELMTYRTDFRTILQENSVKDIQKQEDVAFYSSAKAIATAKGNYINSGAAITLNGVLDVVKGMVKKQVPPGTLLMTQATYLELLKAPATVIGSGLASGLVSGRDTLDNIFGWKIVTTIKNDVVPDYEVFAFGAPEYLGQFYMLQDALCFVKTEGDIITFKTYEAVGMGIGNVNGIFGITFTAQAGSLT